MQVLRKLRSKLPALHFRRPQPKHSTPPVLFPPITDGRYEAFIAETSTDIASALRLRHAVFNVELSGQNVIDRGGIEFDAYDFKCRHLIVRDRETGDTVGTYRINTIETAKKRDGFYSATEFDLSELPAEILADGIEIGRACVAAEHRSTKVLLLLLKGLFRYLETSQKRYFFGCCSIFSTEPALGNAAYHKLISNGHFHQTIRLEPTRNAVSLTSNLDSESADLPALFNMYLRLGAKVCSPPLIDREFGSIDFFVIFDTNDLADKYRKMFAQ